MKARKTYPAIGILLIIAEASLLMVGPLFLEPEQIDGILAAAPVVIPMLLAQVGLTGGLSVWTANRKRIHDLAKGIQDRKPE